MHPVAVGHVFLAVGPDGQVTEGGDAAARQGSLLLAQQAQQHDEGFHPAGAALQLIALVGALEQAQQLEGVGAGGVLGLIARPGAVPDQHHRGVGGHLDAAAVIRCHHIKDAGADGGAGLAHAAGGDIDDLRPGGAHHLSRAGNEHHGRAGGAGDPVALFQRPLLHAGGGGLCGSAGHQLRCPLQNGFAQQLGIGLRHALAGIILRCGLDALGLGAEGGLQGVRRRTDIGVQRGVKDSFQPGPGHQRIGGGAGGQGGGAGEQGGRRQNGGDDAVVFQGCTSCGSADG